MPYCSALSLSLSFVLSESQWSATEAESIDAKRATLAVMARAGRFDRLTEMWRQSTLWPSSSPQSTQQARVWSDARDNQSHRKQLRNMLIVTHFSHSHKKIFGSSISNASPCLNNNVENSVSTTSISIPIIIFHLTLASAAAA
jgi:hypothetical protein